MGESTRHKSEKEGAAERTARIFRNLNAVGALALGGAAVLMPPLAAPLGVLAAIDVAQAGGFEVARRWAKKKRRQS
jgi:hypothetical protein